MEAWRDIVLIISVLGIFVLGFFLMARLDKFLDENRRAIEMENEKREPSCVILTEEMSDEEIAAEVKRFRISTQLPGSYFTTARTQTCQKARITTQTETGRIIHKSVIEL